MPHRRVTGRTPGALTRGPDGRPRVAAAGVEPLDPSDAERDREAWLAVLSLHGDPDDPEWAAAPPEAPAGRRAVPDRPPGPRAS